MTPPPTSVRVYQSTMPASVPAGTRTSREDDRDAARRDVRDSLKIVMGCLDASRLDAYQL
ncbi:hypothetical protein GCM10009827_063090 [Dactylosporangium maewongense]|uniref:Uncharacterized protein n=1 Tax=Dactylosporangium maewongense TaxID=634393 RepID=A0ABP4M395_9ACTN